MHEPRMIHWKWTLHVLAYTKDTPGKCLIYQKHRHHKIKVYSDSCYAGDKRDKKSILGYCTYVRENLGEIINRIWYPGLVQKLNIDP